jgi:hypothetical protein
MPAAAHPDHLFMSQYMTGMLLPERDFRSLVYQAIDD